MSAVREALMDMGIEIENTCASIQGFGTVGRHAAQLYHQMGGRITCVACWNQSDRTAYSFRKMDGIDFDQLAEITNPFGEIDRAKAEALGYECLPGEAWIEQNVDILVPAALENQIRLDNVERIQRGVKIIAEAANGPTNPDVDPILNQRGILVIPDILANAGGVICSYFEQVQSNMNYFWSKDEVLGKLDALITSAYIDAGNFARKNKLSMRDTVYMLAVDRVARACHERGWI
jgi:glutamate dehydrogenase (NAD(P)+)